MTTYIVETPLDYSVINQRCHASGSVFIAEFDNLTYAEVYMSTVVSGSMYTVET